MMNRGGTENTEVKKGGRKMRRVEGTRVSLAPSPFFKRQRLPLGIFILLCLNLVIAPAVYAAADGGLERRHAWTLGILGLVTLGLVVYLFDVVFRPERY